MPCNIKIDSELSNIVRNWPFATAKFSETILKPECFYPEQIIRIKTMNGFFNHHDRTQWLGYKGNRDTTWTYFGN